MSFFDQLSAKVNQGFNQVASQTKDFTEQVKLENEIKNLEKAANACYEKIGRSVYHASRHPSDTPEDYEETMQQIDGILRQITEKKQNRQDIANKVICPSCGKSVPAGTKFCIFCGAPMVQAPEEQVEQTTAEQPPAEQAPVEQTTKEQAPEEQAVDNAAQNAKEPKEALCCPSCGEPVEPGARFCVKCGARLNVEEPAPETETEQAVENTEKAEEAEKAENE